MTSTTSNPFIDNSAAGVDPLEAEIAAAYSPSGSSSPVPPQAQAYDGQLAAQPEDPYYAAQAQDPYYAAQAPQMKVRQQYPSHPQQYAPQYGAPPQQYAPHYGGHQQQHRGHYGGGGSYQPHYGHGGPNVPPQAPVTNNFRNDGKDNARLLSGVISRMKREKVSLMLNA
ncbi:hypothetical protein ScalyP_jg4937 [Parmales sp. scaly parma]|nr:hypothetical protein ScalyP_jg4937 [Parmales sp. scaly parma]